ncbi:MAG TPA: thiamine pyrophosphate-binding protein [Stellaceae bacterium]|nr:thiamine pyrophosphate-binding protein [Stellaceae bacterium]
MAVMAGKRAFLELLKQEGVDIIFGNPGTTELPLMDALAVESKLRYVLGLQEAGVMAMADGYAQAGQRLAVTNFHVAPGLGNAMGMLYDAKKAGSPILVTAGQHDQSFTLTEPILWDDLPPIARPLVKWSSEVHRLVELPRAIHRAAKTALAMPTGPVFLSLPGDVLTSEADIDLGAPTRVAPRVRGDADAVDRAAALLLESKRPLIMAGDGVAQSRAHVEIVAIAELLGSPVHPEGVANTASFPTSHPLFKGALTRMAPIMRAALEQHDVLFSVGGDLFTMSLPSDVDPMPPSLKVVHLDTDAWELGKNYHAEVAILGDVKATLKDLLAALESRMTAAQRAEAKQRSQTARAAIAAELEKLKARARADANTTPMKPLALMHGIGEMLPPDAVIIDESVSSNPGLRQFVRSEDPQSFFGLRGGGIGWGLPAAIGAKLALPDRPVVALIGDGSAMYTCQALWTAAHESVPVVFVIINNASYRILKQRANAMRAHAAQTDLYVGMDLVNPRIDFVGLARSLGVAAERATTVAEVCALIKRGIAGKEPLLIDAQMDSGFKPV